MLVIFGYRICGVGVFKIVGDMRREWESGVGEGSGRRKWEKGMGRGVGEWGRRAEWEVGVG